MGLWEHFPYTNFHELNLNWLLKKVKDNQTEIEKLKLYKPDILPQNPIGENILIIGDSYAHFLRNAPNYPDIIKSTLKCKVRVNSLNGAGFTGAAEKDFNKLLLESPVDDYSTIIFAGGYNDYSASESGLSTAINICLNSARTIYKNARLIICFMGQTIEPEVGEKLQTVKRIYSESCTVEYCTFWDASVSITNRNQLASDGVHPGTNGELLLGRFMCSALSGNPATPSFNKYSLKVSKSGQGNTDFSINVESYNHVYVISFPQITIKTTGALTCDNNHPIEIGTINGLDFNGSVAVPIVVQGQPKSGQYNRFYNYGGDIEIESGKCMLRVVASAFDPNLGGSTAWQEFAVLTSVTIPKCSFVVIQ